MDIHKYSKGMYHTNFEEFTLAVAVQLHELLDFVANYTQNG